MSAPDKTGVARGFDPRDVPPGFIDDPYPLYRALREHAPLHRCPDGSWFLTRYDDLVRIYKDPASFSSDKRIEFGEKYGESPLLRHHTTSLVFNDPPLHTRVRALLTGALSQRSIAALEPDIVALVDGLLDRFADAGGGDAIDDFAAAIPVEVIGNLLGVPRAEREPLRHWSLAILGALEPVLTTAQFEAGNRAVDEFSGYLEGLIDDRRRRPGDPDRDVLTRLLGAGGDGSTLSPETLVHNCIFILNAGHETTTNLIGNTLDLLIRFPQARRRLLDDPGAAAGVVEESLRMESSNQLGNRLSTVATRFGDTDVPAGSRLTLCIGAANRDPLPFPDPDRFDVDRRPNRHLAFGMGPHLCAGISLARLEGRIAIARFVRRFPRYDRAGVPVRNPRIRFRGFRSLPIAL